MNIEHGIENFVEWYRSYEKLCQVTDNTINLYISNGENVK